MSPNVVISLLIQGFSVACITLPHMEERLTFSSVPIAFSLSCRASLCLSCLLLCFQNHSGAFVT